MFAAARAGSEGGCRALKAVSSVEATSLSDVVCGFHVAGYCIETTSDSTIYLAWRFAVRGSRLVLPRGSDRYAALVFFGSGDCPVMLLALPVRKV
jgi:hypothetical protein